MSVPIPRANLSLRRWLVIALIAVVLVPFGITATLTFHFLGGEPGDATGPAAARLAGDASLWHDPIWQEATRADLAAEGVNFVLIENGQEIYRSTADPLRGSGEDSRLIRRLDVADGATARTVYAYGEPTGPPDAVTNGRAPSILVATLVLTLGGLVWFFGRTVVVPLAATNRAANQIAAGDFDVDLPSSRVREVAEVNAAFAAMSDALRASLEQQAEMEQERRLFIGAVVHDLRTPLFSLRGYLEGFAKGLADTPEKQARYVAVAQDKTAALERLISDLFDFTRLEYLDQTPNREPFDLTALLQSLVDDLQPQAELKGVTLTLDRPATPCLGEGDTHLLTRAVENLLDNALRYTPSGGSVRVTCASAPDALTFSVADTGPGIPAQDLPHLFTPLFRGETSRNRRTGGAGLGLTIARRILAAHGGELSVRNPETGGATFIATIPRSHHSTPPNGHPAQTLVGAQSGAPTH
jgi:signal transduction histidine kinase